MYQLAPVRCIDRKSTRLNSSHLVISYAVFCLKKKYHLGEDRPETETYRVRPHLRDRADSEVHDIPSACARAFFASIGPVDADVFFFFNDTATTEIYTLSLHDALPI